MKISDEIVLSARNLTRRKGRTALTLIGVVIGTCMVVLMISLGIAQSQANDEMLQSWGDLTQIQVYGGGMAVGADGKTLKLDDTAIESFKKIDHVMAATAYVSAYSLQGSVTAGTNDRYVMDLGSLTGVDPAALEPMGFQLASGRWPDTGPANKKATKLQVLVGDYTGYNFYDSRKSESSPNRYRWQGMTDAQGNPVEPFVNVDKDKMTLTLTNGDTENPKEESWELVVVGTMAMDEKNYWTQSGIVLRLKDMKMLMEEYNKLIKNNNTDTTQYNQVCVKVDEIDNVVEVSEAIKDLGFGTYSMSDTRKEMQKQVARNQLMLGGLAAISLFVAALNIANTMTMSIYERTREIGVMKVLGCELRNIRRMFLIESGFIGFIGGVAGALLSALVSLVLNNLTTIAGLAMMLLQSMGINATFDISSLLNSGGMYTGSTVISIIPPWLVASALAFATVIGVLSGIAPANRAVKISALEAIRHE